MSDKKRILITGGAGYIGSSLCGYLLQKGYKVTVLDTFMFSNDSLNAYMSNKNFFVYQEDVRDIETVSKYVKKNDIIIEQPMINPIKKSNSTKSIEEEVFCSCCIFK